MRSQDLKQSRDYQERSKLTFQTHASALGYFRGALRKPRR
jgi:hypothetical protein